MSRIACVLLLILCSAPLRGADLPPGAVARLGDDRFRAGGGVSHLALSPDGTRYATAHDAGAGRTAVTMWDADTGRPVHEHLVSGKLFVGLAWGTRGSFAVARRAAPATKDAPATEVPEDFCVWDFTDPKGAPPLAELPLFVERTSGTIDGPGPAPRSAYTGFRFSADGARLAARWEGADEKHAVHVFELKPAASVAKLARVGTIDLGTEGADDFALSADGSAVVTARRLSDPGQRGRRESVVTVWPVARGKPEKPVRVPGGERLMLAPDARSLVAFSASDREWGFDVVPVAPPYKSAPKPERRIRWPRPRDGSDVRDEGGFAFFASGEKLAVAADRGTFVIDTATGKELGRLDGHADGPTAVAVSADGQRIATADVFGLVRLWDAKTFRAIHETAGHRAPVEYAELSPDGKRLLTWASDETVRLWDIGTGKELRAFAGATAGDEGTRPAFTADGTAIVYRAKDRLVARDLQTGLEMPLPGERKPNPVALGTSVRPFDFARASDGGAVVLRETATGAARRALTGHRGEVRVLGFTPDGSKLLTAGGDHTVLVWDVRLQAVPLPDALRNETNAAKLWEQLATGKADVAYLAMARLSRDPGAAVKIAKLRLKPAAKGDPETEEGEVADARAIELLDALGTDDARALLKELAGGYGAAFRTQEGKRSMARGEKK